MKRLANVGAIGILATALILGVRLIPMATTDSSNIAKAAEADASHSRRIVVTGRAEVMVKPDLATLNLGVETRAKTAQDAQAQNAERMTRLMDALKKMGVPTKDMKTSGFAVQAEWNYDGNKREFLGYRVTNELTVTTTNLDQVGALLDACVKAGANQVRGVRFSVQDDILAQAEALKLATAKAKVKAEAIAEALGVKLGPVLSAGDQSVDLAPYVMAMEADAKSYAVAESAPTPIHPGDVKVSATVQIHFAIGR